MSMQRINKVRAPKMPIIMGNKKLENKIIINFLTVLTLMRDMQTQDAHILRNKHIHKKLLEDKRSHIRIKDQIYNIIQCHCYPDYLLGLHYQ